MKKPIPNRALGVTRRTVSARPRQTKREVGENGVGAALLAGCRSGWTLPGEFFRDERIYQLDIERIWKTGWLFAGHSCEIPAAGDYFTLDVGTDSLIIIRDEEGQIRALHNLCRHRGSIICTAPRGHTSRLVCPYHQWTYRLDGTLIACRGMQPDLDKGQFGLHPVYVGEVEGLIFISFAKAPPPFGSTQQTLGPYLRPQGLGRAKVAHAVDYLVNANWKLVWENNRECYHCNLNHPQYIKANFDHYNADDATPQIRSEIASLVSRGEQKWAEAGLAPTHAHTGMAIFPDVEHGIWYSANRTPLAPGWATESMDGKLVAPVMGTYTDPDVGTLRVRALPNFWNHSSCDHSVSTRLLPAGPQQTAVRVYWLVDEKAVEGRDYDLEKVMPFWQLTSEQDWQICERQQRGVNSSAYTPGPYSKFKEYNVENFVTWYLETVKRS